VAQDTMNSEAHLRVRPGGQLWEWGKAIIRSALLIWVLLSMGSLWSIKAISAGYQVIGSLLALLGVAVIANLLEEAAKRTAVAWAVVRPRLAGWWRDQREQLARLWARVRGRPRPAIIRMGTASATAGGSGHLTVERIPLRVDRDTISDRDWLIHLDDKVESIMELINLAEQRRGQELTDIDRRLGLQESALRAEITEARQAGWQLVAGGLFCSLVGAFLSGWA
jgi:hypothetical protein